MKVWRPNVVTRIQTPKGLAFALTNSGGLLNSNVRLIEIDHNQLETSCQKFEYITYKLKEYFSRVNHLYFEQLSETSLNDPNKELLKEPFCFEASAFSSDRRKVKVFIMFNNNVVRPVDTVLIEIQMLLIGNDRTKTNKSHSLLMKTIMKLKIQEPMVIWLLSILHIIH